jgi:hypothetical protein
LGSLRVVCLVGSSVFAQSRDTNNIELKTQNEDKQSNKDTTQKTKKMSNMDSTKNWVESRCTRRISSSCFLLEDTCRIFHTVKSVKNQVGDKGNKMIYVKGKDLLPFEKLPFRNGQPVRDGERRTFVAMTST